jgi:hypothetical protein
MIDTKNNTPVNSAKKAWALPHLSLISQNTVTSGAQPGVHEGQVIRTVPSGGGGFTLVTFSNPAVPSYGGPIANHTKNFYYS